jgi:formamidopyrimidine-DNA glycosylase
MSVEVFDRRLMNAAEVNRWNTHLRDQTWDRFLRKGKYLWIELSNGWRAEFHLRMTGQLILSTAESRPAAPKAHPRLRIRFASGRCLGFYDQRRFGQAWLLAPGEGSHSKSALGPDALTELQREQFVDLVKRRATRIQPLLMDQKCLAGVGNIYAQEALFKAAIRPSRPAWRLTKTEATTLYVVLRETLETAIVYRGSSSRNYRDGKGESGSAQTLHAVYRKGGKPCPRCRHILKSTRVGGRGTVFCPSCQK